MTELIQINSYGKRDIKGKLPRIFVMEKQYKQFKYIKDALPYVHSLSEPSKMDSCGYSISALSCKMGGMLNVLSNSVCSKCYARKGRYIFESCQQALVKRLDKIKNEPLWVDAMIHIINNKKRKGKKLDKFRWHDSGDIQDERHLDMICEIARNTPNVKHWLPTKETIIVREYLKTHKIPKNLNIRVSAFYINGKAMKIKGTTTSRVLTKDMLGKSKFDCPIYANPSHGKTCGDCTMCYDRNIKNVNYLEH